MLSGPKQNKNQEITLRHDTVKLLKTKVKRKILMEARKKGTLPLKEPQ